MHHFTQEVLDVVRRKKVPLEERFKAVEIALSEVIALNLPIPSSPVDELQSYFNAHHKVEALERLADANEACVIDLDRTCELIFKVWNIRYSLVHRPSDKNVGRLLSHAVNVNEFQIPEVYRKVIINNPDAALSRGQIAQGDTVEAK